MLRVPRERIGSRAADRQEPRDRSAGTAQPRAHHHFGLHRVPLEPVRLRPRVIQHRPEIRRKLRCLPRHRRAVQRHTGARRPVNGLKPWRSHSSQERGGPPHIAVFLTVVVLSDTDRRRIVIGNHRFPARIPRDGRCPESSCIPTSNSSDGRAARGGAGSPGAGCIRRAYVCLRQQPGRSRQNPVWDRDRTPYLAQAPGGQVLRTCFARGSAGDHVNEASAIGGLDKIDIACGRILSCQT
jgi:hypothetical protein